MIVASPVLKKIRKMELSKIVFPMIKQNFVPPQVHSSKH